jgi:hypothetical protein
VSQLRTLHGLINRGNNLFLVGFIGVLAIVGLPEMLGEGSVKGGIDEALIALVGLGAAGWYWRRRYARSLVPLAFAGADLLLKVVALAIEDPDDRGDDVGALMMLVVLVVTWTVVYVRSRHAAVPAGLET